MPERPRVAIRVDGSSTMGLGHVARSTTLAVALAERGADVELIGSGFPAEVIQWSAANLRTVVIEPGTCVEEATCIIARHPDLAIVDGYHFTGSFFESVAADGTRYAVIDDSGDTPAKAPTAIVNPGPHADSQMYRHLSNDVTMLLGLDYALVRSAFEALATNPPNRTAGLVFLAMGGSDPSGLTVPIARALAAAGRQVRVALGPSVPRRTEVAAELSGLDDVVVTQPRDYEFELASCELAVLAAGSSVWEAVVVGTPVVAVIVADNQAASATAAHEQGFVVDCVDARQRNDDAAAEVSKIVRRVAASDARPAARRTMSSGAGRAAEALLDLVAPDNGWEIAQPSDSSSSERPLSLRPATMRDSDFLMELRNDALVVRASRSAEVVERAEHEAWLRSSLERRDRRIFVLRVGDQRVGQVRLDRADAGQIVSIALDQASRGFGYGRVALRSLQAKAREDLLAEVRRENAASLALFLGVGFEVVAETADDFVQLRWQRPTSRGVTS